MTARDGIEGVARDAVEAALAAGAEEAEAFCEESAECEVRAYDQEVESLSQAVARGLGLRVFAGGGRAGYAYGTDLDEPGLRALAATAHEAAAAADPDEHGGLPDECGGSDVGGLHSPELGRWPTERKVALAIDVERSARAHEGISQVEQAVYADSETRVALANSRGFAGAYEATAAWSYVSAFAGEGADLMTGLGIGLGRDPAALDPTAIGDEAAERALALAGARQPRSRRCPVVLDALVAASFVGFIGGVLSAEAVQRGRSPFAGREGEEVASQALRLLDDATQPAGLASAPFDAEGSPARATPLVSDGRLETFLFDARSARRAGTSTTGNAVRSSYRSLPSVGPTNLVVEPGADDLQALARSAGEGLLVTDVAGLHSGVNPVSGTFSVGAAGRLIEDGAPAAPVRELTIASDLISMLRAITAVGSESRWVPFGGSVCSAPLLLAEMTVSGS